jgi:hypothetical protein
MIRSQFQQLSATLYDLKLSQQLKAQESFREISLVSAELETSISEPFPLSGPTLTSTLMLGAEQVPETLVFN